MKMFDFDSFERYVVNLLEYIQVDSGESLTDFSLYLHESIENAIFTYGSDNDIYDDYDPLY